MFIPMYNIITDLACDVYQKNGNSLYPSSSGVQQVQELICVHSFRCSEQNHLKHARHPLQELTKIWPSSHKDSVAAVLEQDWEAERRIFQFLKATVNKCLILQSKKIYRFFTKWDM